MDTRRPRRTPATTPPTGGGDPGGPGDPGALAGGEAEQPTSATALLDRLAADPTLEPLPDVDAAGRGTLRKLLRPRWINTGLVVLLAAAGAGVWVIARDDSAPASAATRTTTVRRGALTATVSGTGNLASTASSSVGFDTGGTITSIKVKVGQKVTQGQVLATLDPTDAKASLATAQAQLTTTQAQYDETMAGATVYARRRASLQLSSASQSVSSAKSALSAAKAQYSSDKSTLTAALNAAKARHDATAIAQAQDKLTQTLAADDKAIDQADQQLTSAKNQYAQQQVGYDETVAGPTDAQKAQAAASLRSARTAVDDAKATLAATTLKAPRAGTVVAIAAAVGDTVSGGGSSTSSGTSSGGTSAGQSGASGGSSAASSSSSSSGVLTLTDLTALDVTASIAEADAMSVKVGQEAKVTLSASSTSFAAKVTAVSVVGTTSSNVVTYPVTVTLTDVPDAVLLGASASVTITTASVSDALIAPTSAVTSLGTRHTVTLLKNGVETVTPVEVGVAGDAGTQITSGVSEGDTLVIPTTTTSSGSSNSRGIPGGFGGGFGGGRP